MLIQSHQLTQHRRRQPLRQNHRRRTTPGKRTVRNQRRRHPGSRHLLFTPTKSQSLSLGQQIGHQSIINPARRLSKTNEIHRNNLWPLMQQLEKSMLSIGTRRTPNNRPRGALHRPAIHRNRLAQTLHLKLLQVIRKAPQSMTIRNHRSRGRPPNLAVPNIQQPQQHRHAAFLSRYLVIDQTHTSQHLTKPLSPNSRHQTQRHRRSQRKTTPHPLRKSKHPVRRNTPSHRPLRKCRSCCQMRRHLVTYPSKQPSPSLLGGRQSLGRSKSFRTNHNQGRRRVQPRQSLR